MKNINYRDENLDSSFRPIVGIDLGTTNSSIAYMKNKNPKIITSPKGEKIIPSVVLIDLKDKIIVGQDAKDALVAMTDRSIGAIKRKMGSKETLSIANKKLLPEEISALILKELKKYADEELGEGEKEAVITVPAYFTDEQRRATKKAGELAGFVVERIINEPTAAALAYGLNDKGKDKHILVYDLGGGTFDVSVVEMMGGIMEVKASTGNNQLGGEDFDWILVDWMAEKVIKEHNVDPREDIRAKSLLKDEAEKIKIALSSEEDIEVSIPIVTVKEGNPISLITQIARQDFEKLIDDLLEETMEKVKLALKEAELSKNDIDEILLVGGSTRIPRVKELINKFFDKTPLDNINPEEVVALGAGVQAGIKAGIMGKTGLIFTDVAPFSMGIAVLREWNGITMRPGGYQVIIPRNTTIPVTRSQEFSTVFDGQTAVEIEVFQGENQWVKDNHRLGEFLLEGISENKAGEEKIKVTFRYNLNGILEVTANSLSKGIEKTITVQDALERNSKEAYEESLKKIEALYKEDEEEIEDYLDNIHEQMSFDDLSEDFKEEKILDQGKELLKQLEELSKKLSGDKKKRVIDAIIVLNKGIQNNDIEILQNSIDDTIDLMFDLEL